MGRELLELYKNILFMSFKTGLYEKQDKYKLTFLQRNLLILISKNEGILMTKLCRMMSLQKPAMTRLVDNLEKRNLVKRTSFAGDRRGYAIVLTNKGKGLINELDNKPLSVMENILSRSTPQEKVAIKKGFNIFIEKISKMCSN